MFVLDASLTLSWHFEDESTARSRQLARLALRDGVAVPHHWFVEVANGLVRGERRTGAYPAASAAFLTQLKLIDKLVDVMEGGDVLAVVLPLARAHRLSAYDAGYLELAARLGLPLATFDGRLDKAARSVGVDVIGAQEE